MDEEVSRILNSRTYYDVLEVPRDVDQETLKRSYRKVALRVHPDRCKHEKATEAFQKVSHAYEVLCDEDKRRQYDLYGETGPRPMREEGPGGARVYVNEIDPEIFRQFFGFTQFGFDNGFEEFPFGNVRFRRYNHPRQPQQEFNPFRTFRMLLFLIIFILALIVPRIFSADIDDIIKANIIFDGMPTNPSVKYIKFKTLYSEEPFVFPYDVYVGVYRRLGESSYQVSRYIQNVADLEFINFMKDKCKAETSHNLPKTSCARVEQLVKQRQR